jgi:hypothetical protein
MKFHKLLNYDFEKVVTNIFNDENQITMNTKVNDISENKFISKEEILKTNEDYERESPCMIMETDLFNKKLMKKMSVVSFEYDEENKTLYYLSKPYFGKEYQTKTKNMSVCVDKFEKKKEEKEVELFYSMEFIILKELAGERTEYIEIDLYPMSSSSSFQKKKKIMNRTISKKEFLYSCLGTENDKYELYKIKKNDLFSKLLRDFDFIKNSKSFVECDEDYEKKFLLSEKSKVKVRSKTIFERLRKLSIEKN